MIVLIDNHDETQIVNKLAELHYGFTWNDTVKEAIIGTIKSMGNQETAEEHVSLVESIYDLEDGAAEDILPILAEYGFDMEEVF